MTAETTRMMQELQAAGWALVMAEQRREFPDNFKRRYPWAPKDFSDFAVAIALAMSGDEKSWIVTSTEVRGESGKAFAWNAWEQLSLEAAERDQAWQQRIRSFWDHHLPVVLSLKLGYAFLALEKTSLQIVVGEEPEFEETRPLCGSFAELIGLIAARSPRVEPWI